MNKFLLRPRICKVYNKLTTLIKCGKDVTAVCKSLANKQAEQCKTTTIEVHAEVGKITSRPVFIREMWFFDCSYMVNQL